MYIEELLFYGLPLLAVAFFAVCLCRYLLARRKNRRSPGSIAETDMRGRRILLIVASSILAVLLAVVIFFTIVILTSIAYM